MKNLAMICIVIIASLCLLPPLARSAEKIIKMSTTTSTQDSGLLDVLLPAFEKETGITVKVIAKGTGAALRDGMDGNVDVVFVHAKEQEEDFVRQGYGTKRYAVMHNDFIIVGPSSDPADIKGMDNAADALKKIARARLPFISRGDNSGTHIKEQQLWQLTGLDMKETTNTISEKDKEKPITFLHPKDSDQWYLSIGQGMGKALTFADEKLAYTLADRGTYIKHRFGSDLPITLDILCQGDELLANPYGVIPVNPAKYPHVNHEDANTFALWLVSKQGQTLINQYQLLGRQLFFPDAVPMP